jgi:hypothetical protein
MQMLKNLISLAALTALLGCEHHDEKTGNAVSAATDRNISAQSQSDDFQVPIFEQLLTHGLINSK